MEQKHLKTATRDWVNLPKKEVTQFRRKHMEVIDDSGINVDENPDIKTFQMDANAEAILLIEAFCKL